MATPRSSSPSLADEEKMSSNVSRNEPAHSQTEAAILPDIQQEPQQDVEKAPPSQPPYDPSKNPFDPRNIPDGGLQAWLCVFGASCALFCSFGWINCIGVFQTYYQSHQLSSYSPSTVAWVSSLETFFMFAPGPIVGLVYDNYGPRWILLGGTFLHVFGLMMTSLSSEYYQFVLAQGVCSPIGASMIFYPSMSTITSWFFKRRGLAFGIMAAGSSIGGVILPIMVQRLITEVGFPWSMRIAAFLILFLMIIANLTVKTRLPPTASGFGFMQFIHPLQEVPFDLTAFGCFLFFMALFLPINYIILEAMAHGMSPNLAQYLIAILNAASFFGRTIPGYVSDLIGRFNVMIMTCAFTGVLILAMWLPSTTNAPIIVFSALYGFGSGAFVSMAPSIIAQISDVRKIGVRNGTLFAVLSIAALISNPIGGALITRWHGSYTGLQIFGGVLGLAGTAFIAIARVRLSGFKLVVKI